MSFPKRMAPMLMLAVTLQILAYARSGTPTPDGATKGTQHAQQGVALKGDGEQKFAQNCSRCHKAPESFSPSISGTIVRHMRVRAALSKQDEEEILHFLNP